jgi:hypothetical protein
MTLFDCSWYATMKRKHFKPGQQVPVSGVYRIHHKSHRLMHEATLLEKELFPRCRECAENVRFELAHAVNRRHVLPFRPSVILEEFRPRPVLVDVAG